MAAADFIAVKLVSESAAYTRGDIDLQESDGADFRFRELRGGGRAAAHVPSSTVLLCN